MFLTIFTPTYNRKETLKRLYNSLCNQTEKDFEWLIVDDGSLDDTECLVKEWINAGVIKINYYYQKNAGKAAAHNKGVELSQGKLFVCVDSDDELTKTAVTEIKEVYKSFNDSDIGIIAYKYNTKNNNSVTFIKDVNIKHSTLGDLYNKYGMTGDTMLVYKSSVIKKYSFPQYAGEKFMPEAYLYDLLDQEGTLYVLRRKLYGCEYLDNGYTANIARLLYSNPQGYFAYINQRLSFDRQFKHRLLNSMRYDAMAIAHKRKNYISDAVYPCIAILALPLGYLFYLKKYKEFTEN